MPPKVRKAKGLRERIMAAREANPNQAAGRGAQLRTTAVVDDFAERKAELAPGEPLTVGGVTFYDIRALGANGIEVFTAPDAVESHYRIFNPPTMVRRGDGDIPLRGRNFVEDPLAAIASVIRTDRENRKRAR